MSAQINLQAESKKCKTMKLYQPNRKHETIFKKARFELNYFLEVLKHEKLPISLSSHENDMSNISHYNTVKFLRN